MTEIDFDGLNRAACAQGRSLVQQLIPGGRIKSLKYIVRNPNRNDNHPGSFKINYRTGQWVDFATTDKGSDFVSLVAFLNNISQGDAARKLANMIGTPVSNGREASSGTRGRHHDALDCAEPATNAKSDGAASFPARTPPDSDGKPRFILAGDEGPGVGPNEVRRHVYRREKLPVRVKLKFKNGQFANWYRVVGFDGAVGWQAGKPSGYVDVPYVTLSSNPFDPGTSGDRLYWPEGEKDVDTSTRLELLAFTFGGVGDGLPVAAAEFVAGRHVVILADNDGPGRKHAEAKAAIAHSIAASVRVIEFPEKDLSDWVAQGHTAEELSTLADAAPPFVLLERQTREQEQQNRDELDRSLEGGAESRKKAKAEREAVLQEFNSKYIVVNDGGSVLVFSDVVDEALNRHIYQRMTPGALKTLYLNRKVCTRITDSGERTYKNVADYWLSHEKRRQYINGVIFDPSEAQPRDGYLNLWRGFGFTPKAGCWDRLKDHIQTVLCLGNEEHYDYLMGWMARLVQSPADQGEVAVVMRGDQGTGKGTLGHALLALFRQHGMHISSSKHLVGAFNAHLRDCVVLFADEAFFAGDKASLGVLKALITERVLTIEAKFQNAQQCRNLLHVIMASNSYWVVPAALDERRFFVLDVANDHKQDTAYFGAIKGELESGGYAAMLHELLHRDISKFDVRRVPETVALQTQKKHSLPLQLEWWSNALARGYVFRSRLGLEEYFGQWREWIATDVLFDSYTEFAKARNERHPMGREQFGKFMRDMGGTPGRPRSGVVGEHSKDTVDFGRKSRLITGDRPKVTGLALSNEPGRRSRPIPI